VAAGMYVEAKTGLSTDVKAVIGLKRIERIWANAGQ
jgi:hypothetical protein